MSQCNRKYILLKTCTFKDSPKSFVAILTLFLCSFISLAGQTEQASSYTSDRTEFLMHIDTINHYLYRDAKLVDELIKKCEVIKERSNDLTNDDIFRYITQKIYYELNNVNLLACYQLIKDNEQLLADESILEVQKNNFNYIRAFTYMSLGDSESAQKSYYEILEKGRMQKDSLLIVQSLYSLGQVYGDENDYQSAIKCFLELVDLRKIYTIRPSTHALIDYELSEAFMEAGQIAEAEKVIINGFQFLKEQQIERLKPDFLLLQGEMALDQQQYTKAASIYQRIKELIKDSSDPFSLQASQIFHAKLLTQQEKYTEALHIYEMLLTKVDTSSLNVLSSIYEYGHTTLFKMGNPDEAYRFLLKKQEIAEKIKAKEKEQKTAYLKVKFESEQKEKENQQLALEVLQEQNRNRYLYFIATFFLMSVLLLLWAFNQKRKFSQTLQSEVKSRTQELEYSNKELEKFVYMASHDLKQPLSTIINFSNILSKDITGSQNKESKTQLKFINDNGNRMMNLIEGILEYFNVDKEEQELGIVNLNELIDEIRGITPCLAERKAIITITNPLPTIRCDKTQMLCVFRHIIENGIKYNTSAKPSIIISNKREADSIKLFFQDNGIGIDKQYHHKLFQQFSRLQNHQDYQGAGLGLSICKKIIETMGGKIGIINNGAPGCLFYLTIPTPSVLAYKQERFSNYKIGGKKKGILEGSKTNI